MEMENPTVGGQDDLAQPDKCQPESSGVSATPLTADRVQLPTSSALQQWLDQRPNKDAWSSFRLQTASTVSIEGGKEKRRSQRREARGDFTHSNSLHYNADVSATTSDRGHANHLKAPTSYTLQQWLNQTPDREPWSTVSQPHMPNASFQPQQTSQTPKANTDQKM